MKNQDLIGKTYVDPKDSGDLVIEVVAVDDLQPDKHVAVKPRGHNRTWWRNANIVRQLVAVEMGEQERSLGQ